MSAVVKLRPTETGIPLTLRPDTPRRVLLGLRPFLVKGRAELVDITTTGWYRNMEKRMKPGDYVRAVRQARGMTLREVGERIGATPQQVHDYEAGVRGISKAKAKQFSALLSLPVERLL